MSEINDKRKKGDKELESILDSIDTDAKQGFESELAPIFEDMEKDSDLLAALDKLIDECTELPELQSKLMLLIQEYLKQNKKNMDPKKSQDFEFDEKKITRDAEELCRKLLQEVDKELDPSLGVISRKDRAHILNVEAKKSIKRLMKSFVVYQIYKIMNPKRIAGETVKDNYKHNLMEGGESLASKYEGGKKSDIKKYGYSETERMKRRVADFKKTKDRSFSGGIGR